MDQSEAAALVAFAKFAVHLTARIEALEAVLTEKGLATKEEILEAIGAAESGLDFFHRSVPRPGGAGFDRALGELLERLAARHRERLQ
jgi:inorganic triphosphatase YgiF